MVVVIASAALIGLATLQLSSAATESVALEAESGSGGGNLFAISGGAGVSGGAYVTFGSENTTPNPPNPTPPPPTPTEPTPDEEEGELKHDVAKRCVDHPTNSPTYVQIWDCNGTDPQEITFKPVGSTGQAQLQVRGKCLTVDSNVDNAKVIASSCSSSNAMQHWKKNNDKVYVNAATQRCLTPLWGGTQNGGEVGVGNCNGSTAQNWTLQEYDGAPFVPEQTGYYKNATSSRCLDNAQGKTVEGNFIQIWECNGSAAQKITKRPTPAGYFQLVVQGWCIESYNLNAGTTDTVVKVKLHSCDGRDSQEWKTGSNSSLVNRKSGKCMVPLWNGTQNGGEVVADNCNGSSSQKWSFSTSVPSTPAPPPPPAIRTGAIKNSSGRCLDNAGSKLVHGNKIQLWDCNGSGAQNFTMRPSGDGYRLEVQGWCLHAGYDLGGGNRIVYLTACSDSSTKIWKKKDGKYLVNAQFGQCLVPLYGGTGNGTEVGASNCNNSASQQWSMP